MIISTRLALCTSLLLCAMYPSESRATVASASGTVAEIRFNGPTFGSSDSMFVTGVSSLGTCPTAPTDAGVNLVILRVLVRDPQGKAQLNAALAAQLAGKTVTVFVDDTVVDTNYGACYLRSIHVTP